MLSFDEGIQAAARSANRDEDIRIQARHNGRRFPQEYALEYVRDGLTTMEEVERVVPISLKRKAEACSSCQREPPHNLRFVRAAACDAVAVRSKCRCANQETKEG